MKRIGTCSVLDKPDELQACIEGTGDLLPWADPYIARLLDKHRLEAALHDSLDFLRRDDLHQKLSGPEFNGESHRPWSD